MKIEKVCVFCGGPFLVKPSHADKQRCCSRVCSGQQKGKDALGYDPKRSVEKRCATCDKIFRVKLSHAANEGTYCSRACMSAGYQERLRGNANPNYRAAGVKTCAFCQAEFQSYQKTQEYCSMSCARRGSDKFKNSRSALLEKQKNESIDRSETRKNLPHVQLALVLKPNTEKLVTCGECGKNFYSRSRRKFCSNGCNIKHLAKFNAKPIIKHCIVCGSEMALSPSRAIQVKTCSPECKRQWKSERQRGDKSHRWQGGKTSQAMLLRTNAAYEHWRKQVFSLDNYTCQMCGQRGGKLAAHHIKTFSKNEDARLQVTNGITLCWPCHFSIRAKEEHYEEQFFAITAGRQQ